MASRCGQDRLPLQRCIGWAEGDDAPWRQALTRQVAQHLGPADGVVVVDPSALPTSGTDSVGVARQWCGRLGHVDHGHVAVALGDVSGEGHPLGAMRLSLPTTWTQDHTRLDNAGVPRDRRGDRSRHQWALDRLEHHGAARPPQWIAGDEERGRPSWCRRRLDRRGERSLLAVPGNTLLRDLETAPPPSSGRGRRPQRPWPGRELWRTSLPAEAWTTMDVREGSKGPLVGDLVTRRVVARTPQRQEGQEEMLVIMRSRERDTPRVVKVDWDLANGAVETSLTTVARVAKAAHRLAECLQRRKSEAGWADDAGRHWTGWHPHQTLSFIATWFFVMETRRGQKMDAGDDGAPEARRHRVDPARGVSMRDHASLAA